MQETDISPRAAILDAAQQLILQHGYAGLSMRELSRQSGLAKGTIYYYFQDKQEIFLSALERDIQTVQTHLIQAAEQEGDCIQRLHNVVEIYFTMASQRRFILMGALREIGGMEAELRDLARQSRDATFLPIVGILQEGIECGLFRPINAEMAVVTLLGMMHSFVTHRLLLEEVDEIGDDVVAHILDLFLNGIRTGAVE